MSNRLRMDKQQIIQSLIGLGWSNRQINDETGIHRDTISKYRELFQNRPKVLTGFSAEKGPADSENRPKVLTGPSAPISSNSRNISPYLALIAEKTRLGLTARRIYQDLVEEQDYHGSYDSIQRYIKKLKIKVPKHFDRLPTYPGHEAQVDFGKGAQVLRDGKHHWAWLFKMTLSFSGHSYEELVWKQDMETFTRCHENAFHSFGGVPERIKLDNLKSGVIRACLYEPVLNPVYHSFSQHYGFVPNPCIPRKPEHKGRVEKDVDYTKRNALKERQFRSLEEGNAFLRHWNKRWARQRIHGSKKRQVWQMFCDHEQKALKPLPMEPFPCFKIGERKVDVTGHIEVASNFYSVPHPFIGQKLVVHFNHRYIKVLHDNQVIVRHTPATGKGRCTTLSGHKPSYKPISLEQAEGWQCQKAKAIGPNCHKLVYQLLSDERDPMAIRRTRGILSLRRYYTDAIIDKACLFALKQYVYSYARVKQLCQSVKNTMSHQEPVLTQEHELIRTTQEYQSIIEERSL